MKEKQNSLRTNPKDKAELIENEVDACEICDGDLYYNEKYTKRVGMLDSGNKVCGWMCPHCKTEFGVDDKIKNLGGISNISGEA